MIEVPNLLANLLAISSFLVSLYCIKNNNKRNYLILIYLATSTVIFSVIDTVILFSFSNLLFTFLWCFNCFMWVNTYSNMKEPKEIDESEIDRMYLP